MVQFNTNDPYQVTTHDQIMPAQQETPKIEETVDVSAEISLANANLEKQNEIKRIYILITEGDVEEEKEYVDRGTVWEGRAFVDSIYPLIKKDIENAILSVYSIINNKEDNAINAGVNKAEEILRASLPAGALNFNNEILRYLRNTIVPKLFLAMDLPPSDKQLAAIAAQEAQAKQNAEAALAAAKAAEEAQAAHDAKIAKLTNTFSTMPFIDPALKDYILKNPDYFDTTPIGGETGTFPINFLPGLDNAKDRTQLWNFMNKLVGNRLFPSPDSNLNTHFFNFSQLKPLHEIQDACFGVNYLEALRNNELIKPNIDFIKSQTEEIARLEGLIIEKNAEIVRRSGNPNTKPTYLTRLRNEVTQMKQQISQLKQEIADEETKINSKLPIYEQLKATIENFKFLAGS